MSTQTITPVETEAQALHRLARRAHESGVRLIVAEDNRHWVTSASRPGHKHVVTLYSCDCVGFARHARCMHLALVLEAYHSLPPIDGPEGGAALPLPAPTELHINCGVIEDGAYLRRGNALGILDDRQKAALAALDAVARSSTDAPAPIAVVQDGALVDGVEVDFAYADGRWTLSVASREGMQELIIRDRERHVAQAIREAIEGGKPAQLTRTEAGGPEITLGYRMGLAFEPVAPAVVVLAVGEVARAA